MNTISCSNFSVEISEEIDTKRKEKLLDEITPTVDWTRTHIQSLKDVSSTLIQDNTPWFTAWQNDFFKSMNFSPHELIDMPLAIMIVASTADADPIATFQALMRTQALPQHYHIKVYDEKVPKLYLLLHDNKETSIPEARVLEIYETMKRTFGHSLCHWQTLNSSSEDETPSPWGPEKGIKISQAERFQLQVFVNEILTRVIIPYVEFKLKELDGIFEQKRRGLKNSISRFFQKNQDRIESFKFQLNEVEHVTRLIADIAFLFRDYELAIHNYKKAYTEFKSAKAYLHAASAVEMQALSCIMINPDIREVEYCLDTAYSSYQLAKDNSLLIRCGLITRLIYQGLEYNPKLTSKMLSLSTEQREIPEVVPLILEQVAYSYLRYSTPYYRKFAFYLVIAGDEYRNQQLIKHALNCYFIALNVYKGKKWDYISMHIEHMLGRFCYFLDLNIESVHFFLSISKSQKLLSNPHDYQKKILNELMATVSKWTDLPVPPEVDPLTQEVFTIHDDGKPNLPFTLPSIKSREMLLPTDEIPSSQIEGAQIVYSWIDIIQASSLFEKLEGEFKRFDGMNVENLVRNCHVGESITVRLKVYNPLQLLLIVENLHLIVAYEDESGTGAELTTKPRTDLKPQEELSIELQVTPHKVGQLRVKGVKWTFGNIFHGVHYFKEQIFNILPRSSTLQVTLSGSNLPMYHGQVDQITLNLKNEGIHELDNISIFMSHSYMFGEMRIDVGTLEGNDEKEIKLWIRAEGQGVYPLRFVVIYNSGEEVRFVRLQKELNIQSAVKIVSRYDPSLKNIEEDVLQINVISCLPGTLKLNQLSALSNHSLRLIDSLSGTVFYLGITKGTSSQDLCIDQSILLPSEVREGFIKKVSEELRKGRVGVDLVLCWENDIDGRIIRGYNYILGLKLHTPKDKLPIQMTIHSPSNVSVNFESNPLATVPIKIKLKNLRSSPLTFLIDALDSDSLIEERENPNPPYFTWSGSTSHKVENLPGDSIEELTFNACFHSSGCYNLNRFCFTLLEEKPIKYIIFYQHYILIN